MKALVCSAITMMVLMLAGSSRADLRFCNNSSNEVWVAVTFNYGFYNPLSGACAYQPVEDSWYAVSPNGGCTTVVNGDLQQDCTDTNFYWFAEDSAGGVWDGSQGTADAEYCPQGVFNNFFPQQECTTSYRSFRIENFGQYDNYTMNLQ